jgi:Tfp pilus assembly protein PilF
VYNHIATALFSMEKDEQAVGYLKKTLELDPNNFEARMNFATLYNHQGKRGRGEGGKEERRKEKVRALQLRGWEFCNSKRRR